MSDKLSSFNDVNVSTKDHCILQTPFSLSMLSLMCTVWDVWTNEQTNFIRQSRQAIEQAET